MQKLWHVKKLATLGDSKQTQTPLKQTKLNAVHLYCILITQGIFLHFVIVGLYTNASKGHTTVVAILLYLLVFQNTVLQWYYRCTVTQPNITDYTAGLYMNVYWEWESQLSAFWTN